MTKIFFNLILFSSVLYCQGQELPYNPQHYIEWSEHYKLTWEVFRGKVVENRFGDAGTAVKIKASPYFKGRELNYEVYALFSKNKSWFKVKNPKLLSHEQLHFDIAELTARQVRKEVERLRNSGKKDPEIFNRAIKKILHKSNDFDSRYDKETFHGVIADKQQEWEEYIEEELARLENYKRTPAVVGQASAK